MARSSVVAGESMKYWHIANDGWLLKTLREVKEAATRNHTRRMQFMWNMQDTKIEPERRVTAYNTDKDKLNMSTNRYIASSRDDRNVLN